MEGSNCSGCGLGLLWNLSWSFFSLQSHWRLPYGLVLRYHLFFSTKLERE